MDENSESIPLTSLTDKSLTDVTSEVVVTSDNVIDVLLTIDDMTQSVATNVDAAVGVCTASNSINNASEDEISKISDDDVRAAASDEKEKISEKIRDNSLDKGDKKSKKKKKVMLLFYRYLYS